MSKLKIAIAAGTLAIAMAGCTSRTPENAAPANAVAADVTPANEAMMPANEAATDNSGVAENATNATNSTDEDQASSGGVVLKE